MNDTSLAQMIVSERVRDAERARLAALPRCCVQPSLLQRLGLRAR